MSCLPSRVGFVLSLAVCTATASAQCSNPWLPGDGCPGTDRAAACGTMWDPDGAGPAAPLLVVGGSFEVAGSAVVDKIAAWNPATGAFRALGAPFGAGVAGTVAATVARANGELLAALSSQGAAPTHRVARWTVPAWVQLGGAFDGPVLAMAELPNGDVVVGGSFANVGGVPANRLARWNGTAWSAFGTGAAGLAVHALAVTAAGDLLVGGSFTQVDGVNASCIARWNGAVWSPLGAGVAPLGSDRVQAIAELANGDVVAGGLFANAGGVPCGNIARWNGASWSSLLNGVSAGPVGTGSVRTLQVLANGELVVGGVFLSASGLTVRGVARWNGLGWLPLGPGFQPLGLGIHAAVDDLVQLPSGDLVACGTFRSGGGQLGDRVSRWDGTSWHALARGFNDSVACIAGGIGGQLVAGGSFTMAGDGAAQRVARWDGTRWVAMGSGLNGPVNAAAVAPNGDVVVGGTFTLAGSAAVNRIARWNGTEWQALGTGLSGSVNAVVFAGNDLYAAGDFLFAGTTPCNRIARWTGTTWTPLAAGLSGPVFAMVARPDGSIVVAGAFSPAGTSSDNVAIWGQGYWGWVGTLSMPNALAVSPAGQLFAANGSEVVRWSGTSWVTLGAPANDTVRGIAALPDGDVVATGDFTTIGGVPASRLARWNGAAWTPVDAGVDQRGIAVTCLPWGDLAVGGMFTQANGVAAAHVARLGTTCRASAVAYGTGCSAAGGGNTLTLQELPWLGGVLRTRSPTGIPIYSPAIAVTGFSPLNVPLASVTPAGLPGCTLLVSPDVVGVVQTVFGTAYVTLSIPNEPSLVGATFFHQHVALEHAWPNTFVGLSSTNAFACTIGTL